VAKSAVAEVMIFDHFVGPLPSYGHMYLRKGFAFNLTMHFLTRAVPDLSYPNPAGARFATADLAGAGLKP